jgi:hypothetical protein
LKKRSDPDEGGNDVTPTEFRDRLQAVARATGLTASDFAVWFATPRPTIRSWLFDVAKPEGHDGRVDDELRRRLKWLEDAGVWFPIPFNVRRRFYLEAVLNEQRLRSARRSPVEPAPADPDF